MSVNTADPGAGEPAGIRSLAAARVLKAAELRAAHAEVAAAADTVAGTAWQGKAQQAFQSAMGSVTPDLLPLAEGLEAQATALQVYAGQVQQIKDQQAALALQRSRALSALDVAQSTLNASHLLDDRVLAQEKATGQEVHRNDILRKRARLVERIEGEEAVLRRVDAQWDDLVTWRRHADRACMGALTTREVLGNTGSSAPAESAPPRPPRCSGCWPACRRPIFGRCWRRIRNSPPNSAERTRRRSRTGGTVSTGRTVACRMRKRPWWSGSRR